MRAPRGSITWIARAMEELAEHRLLRPAFQDETKMLDEREIGRLVPISVRIP
jgi:type II secretory pathway component PulK